MLFAEKAFSKRIRRMQEDIEAMHRNMDQMLSGIFREGLPLLKTGREMVKREARIPATRIEEKGNMVVASFELPGMEKNDITLNVTNNTIEVSAEKKEEKELKGKKGYSYAAMAGRFYRALTLPHEVVREKAKATYKNGVLTVEIPKAKKKKLINVAVK